MNRRRPIPGVTPPPPADDEVPARDGNTVVKIPVEVLFTRSYDIRPEDGLPKRRLRFVEHGG